MEQQINNYSAARTLDWFYTNYVEPIHERIKSANELLKPGNPQNKMTATEQEKAEKALESLRKKSVDYGHLHANMKTLITQHEGLVSKLCDMYYQWKENISYEGRQPVEMMQSQADMLTGIFTELGKILEPLKLEENE